MAGGDTGRRALARAPLRALLLNGGGLGGGVAAVSKEGLGEATAPPALSLHRHGNTTIPGPSSIEEEGRRPPADGLSPAPRRAKLAHHIGEILS